VSGLSYFDILALHCASVEPYRAELVRCEDLCGYEARDVMTWWNGAEFGYECPDCPAVAVVVA
jgi:hypothetical protein